MMKFIVDYLLVGLVIVVVFTQIIIPSFIPNVRFFWFFKSKIRVTDPPPAPTLDELNNEVKQSVQQYTDTKKKVDTVAKQVSKMQDKLK